MNHRLLLLPCVLALAAPLHAQRVATRPRDRISREEVRASAAGDALQLVRALRPGWLTRRETRLVPSPRPAPGATPRVPSPRRSPAPPRPGPGPTRKGRTG
jgi:hypothetical protein